jgi:hypothetical protein
VRYTITVLPGSDEFEDIKMEYVWHDSLHSLKLPKFKSNMSLIDHITSAQLVLNKNNRSETVDRVYREDFLTYLIDKYSEFIIEYDENEYMYMSMLLIISTPSQIQSLSTNLDILGAAVVNIHLPESFPANPPSIIFTSPLFFEHRDLCIPSSRPMHFNYFLDDPAIKIGEIVSYLIFNKLSFVGSNRNLP